MSKIIKFIFIFLFMSGTAYSDVDIGVTITVNDPEPTEGDTIWYTISITNSGSTSATGVELTDTWPSIFLIYSNDFTTRGTYVPGSSGIWSVGNLASGESVSLVVTGSVDVGAGGELITNQVFLTSVNETDVNAVNDSDFVVIAVGPGGDLDVSKSVSPGSIFEGDTTTFTIVVTNLGPKKANNIEVTDSLPPGLTYVSHVAGQGSYNEVSGIWLVGKVEVDEYAELTIVAFADMGTAGTSITNSAELTSSAPGDPNPDNDSDTAAVIVLDSSITIGNRVWNDLNGDGVQDAGEPGIPSVTMKLYTNGVLVTSVVTDSNGGYLFTNLLAGTYTVVVDTNTMSADLAANPTHDRDGILDHQTTVTVAVGDHLLDADFGYDQYPLLVVVNGFNVKSVDGETLVSWEVELEVGTIGYYLERLTDNGWIRINSQLISRPLFDNMPPPYSYSVIDAGVESGETYTWRVVELDNQGRLLDYGPFTVTVDGAAISYETWSAGIDWNGKDSSRDDDADGDGFSNFEEYLAGTDPLDANSLLKISGLNAGTVGNVVIRWNSVSGIIYSIELSTNITGNWLPIVNGIQATPPMNVNTILIDSASVPQMFFRVMVK